LFLGGGSSKLRVEAGGSDTGDRADKTIEASGGSVEDRGGGNAMVEMAQIGGGSGPGKETRERVGDLELSKRHLEVGFNGGGMGRACRARVGAQSGGKGLRATHFQ
jgi:hypothetical protein